MKGLPKEGGEKLREAVFTHLNEETYDALRALTPDESSGSLADMMTCFEFGEIFDNHPFLAETTPGRREPEANRSS